MQVVNTLARPVSGWPVVLKNRIDRTDSLNPIQNSGPVVRPVK